MRAAPPTNVTRTTSRRVRSESCYARAHNGITIPISEPDAHAPQSTNQPPYRAPQPVQQQAAKPPPYHGPSSPHSHTRQSPPSSSSSQNAHARFSTLTGDEIEDRAQQGGPAAVRIGHRASSPAGSSVAALSRVYGIKNLNVGVNFRLFR